MQVPPARRLRVLVMLLALCAWYPPADSAGLPAPNIPSGETLSYNIEWRLIYAGSARLSIEQRDPDSNTFESKLRLESAGVVSKLYKLEDSYRVDLQDQFCATATDFDANEGKRHRDTQVTYDADSHTARYVERDVLKNTVIKSANTEIPDCVSDIIGALYKLRTVALEPGQSTRLPVSDGKKSVSARVAAQAREEVKTKAGTFNTIRYEAFIFNGALYKRNARLQVWLTDDARRLPVQIQARMPFPVGTITVSLEKEGI